VGTASSLSGSNFSGPMDFDQRPIGASRNLRL
jgi:hypothetical protein